MIVLCFCCDSHISRHGAFPRARYIETEYYFASVFYITLNLFIQPSKRISVHTVVHLVIIIYS